VNAPALAEPPSGVARRFAAFTLAYTVFVILFGAVVRITGSGAGCGQHWPTCHGEIAHLPRTLATAIELTHRVTSGLALVAVLGLFGVTFRRAPSGHPARKLAAGAVLLMLLEALIGAGLVLLELVAKNASVARAIVMPAHLLSTYALTAVLTLLVVLRDDRTSAAKDRPVWLLLVACGVALVVVSATGAVTALGDTLYPPQAGSTGSRLAEDQASSAHFLMRLRIVHPVLAVLAAALVASAARRIAARLASPRLRSASRTVVVFVAVQLAAGVLNVFLSAPGWLQVAHLALALGLWIAFVLLAYEVSAAEPA
jgi:cytochrome c oxidase assembly protein subunit 15